MSLRKNKVTVSHEIEDLSSNALDGDADGVGGDDFVLHFSSCYVDSPYGNGCDGDLYVDSPTSVNEYYQLGADYTPGNSFVTLADAAGLVDDREILVIQLRGPEQQRGQFEFARGTAVIGNSLFLENPLQYSYTSDAFVVTVPNYANAHVTANGILSPQRPLGSTGVGGILAFRVQDSLTVDPGGQINADGYGFEGGQFGYYIVGSPLSYGWQGKSHVHYGIQSNLPNGAGGGGGQSGLGSNGFGGGGGGGHALPGGAGGGQISSRGLGGEAVGFSCLIDPSGQPRIFAGSGGGGSGAFSEARGWLKGVSGGNGGGIIIASARMIDAQGEVTANGTTMTSQDDHNGSGGGSGGTIWLNADIATIANLFAEGAPGDVGIVDPRLQLSFSPKDGGSGSVGIVRVNAELPSFGNSPNPAPCLSVSTSNVSPDVTVDSDSVLVGESQIATNTGIAIDYDGDSVTLSASVGEVVDNGDGTWSWSHTPDDGSSDSQTVSIIATDEYGEQGGASFELTVNNVSPTATFGNNGPVDEGSSFILTLTDPSDPSAADTAAGFQYAFDCGGDYGEFSGVNSATCMTVDDGVLQVRGKIRDKDGGVREYNAQVTVNNLPPIVTAPTNQVADEATVTTFMLGSFTDSGDDDPWQVRVAWGDGTGDTVVNVETLGDLSSQQHAYGDNGTYRVDVTVTEKEGAKDSGSASFHVTVSNLLPTALDDEVSISEDDSGQAIEVLGNDSDPAGAADPLTVSDVDTTDTIGAVSRMDEYVNYDPGGSYESLAVGEIAEDSFGYTIDDGDGGTASARVQITIDGKNDAPTVAVTEDEVLVDETRPAANSGTYGDVDNGASVFLSASVGIIIDNGDGTWSWSHTPDDGSSDSQVVSIIATDEYGEQGGASFELTVKNVAPTAAFGNDGPVDEGSSFTLTLADATDPSSADMEAGFEYAFDCGDGYGNGTFSGNNSASCSTNDEGVRQVKGRIRDKDGGVREYNAEVTVNNLPPTVTAPTGKSTDEATETTFALGSFTDYGDDDPWQVRVAWGDGSSDTIF